MNLQQAIVQVLAGCVGSFGFAILFNIRGIRMVVAGLSGLLSWALFLLLQLCIPNDAINYLLVAFALSLFAEIMARILKTPTTAFIITSLIPLIPGGSLYYTMAFALQSDSAMFIERGLYTLQLAAALALGIILAVTATRLVMRIFFRKTAKT